MKRRIIYLVLVISGLLTGVIYAHQFTVSKVGEWGTGAYNKVYVKGNYAYCAAGYAGLDIINIANPANPQKVGNYDTPDSANDVYISGNYAYVADIKSGLQIIDITSPSSPKQMGACDTPGYGLAVDVKGNYAYIADAYSGMQIIDVSDPSAPILVGNFPAPHRTSGVYVVGNYAYVIMGEFDWSMDTVSGGLIILDISNPASPQQLGTVALPYATGICVKGNYAYITAETIATTLGGLVPGGFLVIEVTDPSSPVRAAGIESKSYFDIDIKGNYAYCTDGRNLDLSIIDISTPTNPIILSGDDTPGKSYGVHISGDNAYVASLSEGLKVVDITEPTNPVLTGSYDTSGNMDYLSVSGNYAYTGDFYDGKMQVIDISTPASPTRVGTYDDPDDNMRGLFVKGKYAYVEYSGNELRIIDTTTPTSPVLAGTYEHLKSWSPAAIYVSGNNAYVAAYQRGVTIIDISTPSGPTLVKNYEITRGPNDIYVKGNYAYLTLRDNGLKIIDISIPAAPTMTASIDLPNESNALFVSGNYAYVASTDFGTASPPSPIGKLYVVNVANPASPSLVGSIDLPKPASDVYISGNYAYVTCGLGGLNVIDISKPATPTLAASYDTSGPAEKVNVKDNYIYVANGESGKLLVLQSQLLPNPPHIHLNRTALAFATRGPGITTYPQTLFISNTGESALEWSVSVDQAWLLCSPTGGTNSGEVSVSVHAAGLSAGTYTAEINVSAPDADNSPQEITVTLKVYDSGQTADPFGQFETPVDGSTVSGSVPVTGWVLDDIGVQRVHIFRGEPDTMVYIGNAVFVEGARPDVEQTYPGYPMNYKAGWGYMLLTHFLPGGNGVFTLHVMALDVEGNYVWLGSKTITVDNAHAVKPFGTLDTPTQGGIVSGRNCPNFGWVLTPQPNTVPIDGSTIHVWVDGVEQGSPVYNQYREDIASFFPDYNNSGGAVGYFDLDTTQFANGVHTISWTATDDAGNSEGIGSRYFSIKNTGSTALGRGEPACSPDFNRMTPLSGRGSLISDRYSPVYVSKGYDRDTQPQQIYPDRNGNIRVEIKELERVAIQLKDEQAIAMDGVECLGYLSVGNRLKPLPIGSTMDVKRGIFYWQPGPGFVGSYRLVFIKKDSRGQTTQKNITVKIIPKFQ
ncbi:MAG: hypothetical protein QG657_1930 [Acidobacteriota bacterium]|nr:hypothetical protein [Acidobacteriota bacterium]